MKRILVLLGLTMSVLIAGTFTSCEKYLPYINEDDVPKDTTGTDTTGGVTPFTADCKSLPYRNGSEAILKDPLTSATHDYKGVGDTTIAGLKYAKTSIKTGSMTAFQYFGIEADGSMYMHMPKVAMTDIPAVTVKLYDATKAVGDSWEYKYDSELMPGMGESTYTIKLLDNKVNATFQGKKYTSGYKFSLSLKTTMMGMDMGTVTTETEWVCGLGVYSTKVVGGNLYTLATYKY